MRIRLECETDQPRLAGQFVLCAQKFWRTHRCSKSISGGDLGYLDRSQDEAAPARSGQYVEFGIEGCVLDLSALQDRLKSRGFDYESTSWTNAAQAEGAPPETTALTVRFTPAPA